MKKRPVIISLLAVALATTVLYHLVHLPLVTRYWGQRYPRVLETARLLPIDMGADSRPLHPPAGEGPQAQAWRKAAFSHARAGDLERARELYERVVALSPDDGGARLNLARIYMKRGDYEQALRQYRIILGEER